MEIEIVIKLDVAVDKKYGALMPNDNRLLISELEKIVNKYHVLITLPEIKIKKNDSATTSDSLSES